MHSPAPPCGWAGVGGITLLACAMLVGAGRRGWLAEAFTFHAIALWKQLITLYLMPFRGIIGRRDESIIYQMKMGTIL